MTADDPKIKDLEQEQNELRHMINQGLTFDVEVTYSRRRPGLFGFFRKREKVTEKRVYKIYEPTLATLDRLSALWLQMEIDETRLNDANYLATARKMANKEAKRLAEVVAVAVLGEDLYDTTEKAGTFIYKPNEDRLQRLASTFFHVVKPSQLFTLAVLITNVSNLGDFISSIRLMSATRTSDPMANLIEQPA
jgi:hypothetical protein|nr:MAG TPA: hypothetical protein [Caudoviricetes sp.]